VLRVGLLAFFIGHTKPERSHKLEDDRGNTVCVMGCVFNSEQAVHQKLTGLGNDFIFMLEAAFIASSYIYSETRLALMPKLLLFSRFLGGHGPRR